VSKKMVVSAVAAAKELRPNRRRSPLVKPRTGPPGQSGRGDDRRMARRATTRLAHRTFIIRSAVGDLNER
jgi:hypothetical protein